MIITLKDLSGSYNPIHTYDHPEKGFRQMFWIIKSLARMLSFFAVVLLVLSCANRPMIEYSGTPINEYEKSQAAAAAAALEKQKENERAIAALSQVTENQVFTEKRGISEYKVGPQDVLTINIWSMAIGGAQTFEGFKQMTYNVEVRPDGKISYMYGDNIQVSGLTTDEIQQKLLADLKAYFRAPRLEVIVKEYKSKYATLFGQINTLPTGTSGPGRYPLMDKTTVLDLISKAGGPILGRASVSPLQQITTGGIQTLIENADLTKVELLRRGKSYTFNLYKAMFFGDATQNPVLDAGDVVTVPPEPYFADRVYVFGQVLTVGIFRLKDAPDLLSALALAGGANSIAIKTDIKVIREYKERNGKPLILAANYNKIMYQGDLSQNIKLKSGDVVYVPRLAIGDLNEFIVNITPLMDYLVNPRTFYNLEPKTLRW